MMINGHDIPEIAFFENKNVFTGSDGKNFRYRLANSDGKLEVSVWYEDICFELCHDPESETFELSNDALPRAVDWIFSHKK